MGRGGRRGVDVVEVTGGVEFSGLTGLDGPATVYDKLVRDLLRPGDFDLGLESERALGQLNR